MGKVDFETAWLQLPGGVQMHLIASNPAKPPDSIGIVTDSALTNGGSNPERFIRRCHHLALTVQDIDQAKRVLEARGIPYAVNSVPGTPIMQLFVYDPDGNGV